MQDVSFGLHSIRSTDPKCLWFAHVNRWIRVSRTTLKVYATMCKQRRSDQHVRIREIKWFSEVGCKQNICKFKNVLNFPKYSDRQYRSRSDAPECIYPVWYSFGNFDKFHLTLKAPRKTASENVVCLCRLLNILANFIKPIFAYRQTVWTQIRLLLWSGSTLFAEMTLKTTSRWQSRRQ